MIDFSPPRIDKKTVEAVAKVMFSGWITTGPKTKEFEQKIADYCHVPKVLCVASATAGLELILRWFGVKEGDEVIVPAYTYCATANVIIHCGATPVMVDICDDFTINVQRIQTAITSRTKVIIPVDIGGYPADYDVINALVKSPEVKALFKAESPEQQLLGRILVMADAAHSFGALYKGKTCGSFTDITVFSFHAIKNLTTAEGGANCFNLPDVFDIELIYKQFYCKILHGQSKDAYTKLHGSWRYDVLEAGYKCNMTDILAAIGVVEIDRYKDDMLVKRKSIFERYTKAFSKIPSVIIPPYESDEKTSSYHLYLLRVNNITEEVRDAIIQQIFDNEVAVNVHFIPLPMLTVYKNMGYQIEDYPQTYQNYSCEISIPVYYDLTDQEVETVIKMVSRAIIDKTQN
ncbi:MAG: DegT/DnrJ/EryC1/StrS family aminotransferase [Bacteroidales bacterium]|jgi:dTDP-4-amino-4,6-dideoxygalactose transaminase|nr:DegT/DnrJ/EryC1/StrS family aminotransferase [Bacteroidales bacterium]